MVCIKLHQAKAASYFRKTKVSILNNCSDNMTTYRIYQHILFILYSDYPFILWFIHPPLVRKKKKKPKPQTYMFYFPTSFAQIFPCYNISNLYWQSGPCTNFINFSCHRLRTSVCLSPGTITWHLPCQIRKGKGTALEYISFLKVYLPRTAKKGHRRAQKVSPAHKKYLNSHRTVAP